MNTTRGVRSNEGGPEPLATIVKFGVDVRLNPTVPGTGADFIQLAAAIGAQGVMEVRNDTGQYLEILGIRVGDTSGNDFPFLTYVQVNHQREWTQNITGCGIHNAFLAKNGPWGTPLYWRDADGPGRSSRVWGLRGLSPWEVLRFTFRNLTANQPTIRVQVLCRTKAPTFSQPIPSNWMKLQETWQRWQSTYQAWSDEGKNGDVGLYNRQGVWKFFPLFDNNLPGALVNTAAAGFGAIRVAANGESGPLPLPIVSTPNGLIVVFAFLATSSGAFDFELLGGGYEMTRDGFKFVSAAVNQQWNAGRTNNGFYCEGPLTVPRPYYVEDPPQINLRDRSGAQNDIYFGIAGIECPILTWGQGGGGR